MMNSQRYKKQSVLLVLLLLLNPLLTSASGFAMSASFFDATSTVDISTKIIPDSNLKTAESCHNNSIERVNTDVEMNGGVPVDQIECCDSPCQCGASGCHSFSTIEDSQSYSLTMGSFRENFVRGHYLSLTSSPSFPPPIS